MKYNRTQWLKTDTGYKIGTVTVSRKNKNAQRTRTNPMALGILTGSVLGSFYLQQLGSLTIDNLYSHFNEEVQAAQTERVEIAEAETGSTLSEKQQIINYIVEIFGEDSPDAFNVLFCENRQLDPNATNYNRNGTVDSNIFQINSIHTKRFGDGFQTDWKENIDVAKQIFDEQGWTPWTCATRIGVKNYLYK